MYVLGKQVQWLYPHEFGNIIWMMVPLRIEMMFLNIIDTWLDRSGWSDLYEKSGIKTFGRVNSFLKGNHVKQSCNAQQIILAALVKLAHQAHLETDYSCYDDWMKSVIEFSNTAFYWFLLKQLQLNLFLFILRIREENFDLFVRMVDTMLSRVFTLKHIWCQYLFGI